MKKNILINEAQEKYIMETMRLNEALSSLPAPLLNDLKNPSKTSIGDCEIFFSPILKRYIEHIVVKRFEEIHKYFLDDVSNVSKKDVSNKIDKLMKKCIEKEKSIRPQLESLCYEVLTEIFDIPEDSFTYECHLLDGIDDNRSVQVHAEPINFDDSSFREYGEADNLMKEVQKRRIMNLLCVGASMVIYEKAKEIYLHKIFELDEELPHLYSRILKLNELYLFISKIKIRDGFLQQGGYVEVTLPTEESIAKINANAMIFPILLTESIKGILELSASFGLPDEQELANRVMKIADSLDNEPWDMRLGPSMFNSIFSKIDNLDTKDLPFIFKGLSEQSYETFFDLLKSCFVNADDSFDKINNITQHFLHDKEYGDFENNLMQKQNNNLLLNNYNL